ncbi:hypothetical protein H2203_004826 [Taxawa tesnikishii (nom. ined.)]|nr:hypothetical protein H2203_004826 [Dothideales sp. JES 119]
MRPPHRWAAYEHWSVDYLLSKYADVPFRAESVDWPFRSYVEYMRSSSDESPLYLFDHSFAEKMQVKVPEPTKARLYERSFSELKDRIVGTHCTSVPFYYPNSEKTVKPGYRSDHDARTVAYWPPTCFGPKQDLFSVLGDQRPHHRWLIIGPARSGSTFHKDPNGTCAWNAVLRGRKYWIMFPSSSNFPPPPGVFVSEDQSEVTSPLSIAEWLLGFHAEARHTPGCIEAICEEGEMLYVPAGWYHLVVNLEESIALTQNFVPRRNLKDVLAFLRDQKDSISGFADSVEDPYGLFVEELRRKEPEALTEALEKLERDGKGKRGRWEELTGKGKEEDGESAGGFSFGFGGDDEDGEVP